jgi:hypothetical protein
MLPLLPPAWQLALLLRVLLQLVLTYQQLQGGLEPPCKLQQVLAPQE